MKIFLAGNNAYTLAKTNNAKAPFLLQTFYDLRNKKEEELKIVLNSCDDFILDSGAFTFMNSGKQVDLKTYVDSYINFINKYDIKNFIELDLDRIYGLELTEKIRAYIEDKTRKQVIPVWHKGTRNLAYFDKMCEDYNYIAMTVKMVKNGKKYYYDKSLVKTLVHRAHVKGVKVHGLGYMALNEVNYNEIGFDTIDATNWNGALYRTLFYEQNKIIKSKTAPKGVTSDTLIRYSYNFWSKVAKEKYEREV